MLLKASVVRSVLSVLLSATMALPAPSFAAANEVPSRADATDGVQVLYQEVTAADGRPATIMLAAIPGEQAPEHFARVAAANPDRTVLEIAGSDDPVLKAVAKTGYLQRIRTFIVGESSQAPLYNSDSVPSGLRAKWKAAVDRITNFCKREGDALQGAFAYSGIEGSYTFLASGSIPAGLAVFSKVMAFNAFVVLRPEYWGRALEAGGDLVLKGATWVSKMIGVEMSAQVKKVFETVGKFNVAWAVNTLEAGMIKGWSGDFAGLSGWTGIMEGFAEAAFAGFHNNVNIWDEYFINQFKQGLITETQLKKRLKRMQIFAALMQCWAYSHKFHSELAVLFLGMVSVAGLYYVALSEERQTKLKNHALKFHVSYKAGIANLAEITPPADIIKRRFRLSQFFKSQKPGKGCETYLTTSTGRYPLTGHTRSREDLQ